jgi:dTDP-4-dehydrorhamnose reductase
MRMVVTGLQGQVSRALQEIATEAAVEVIPVGRPDLDLFDAMAVRARLEALKPDILVSAAAYTAVDQAESEAEAAQALNAGVPAHLSAAAAALGIPILHLSTDYVFDGTKPVPYREDDATGPTSSYGRSKLAGERAVAEANPRHVILRTAWVYSHEGKNFLRTMLRLAESRPELTVVSDQLGCPSYAIDIAQALVGIARQAVAAPAGDARFGLFHMAGSGDTSWAGFATAIFEFARENGLPAAEVKPISTTEYPTPARRPANSRLDCSRLMRIYGIRLPHWHSGMQSCIARLAGPKDTQ